MALCSVLCAFDLCAWTAAHGDYGLPLLTFAAAAALAVWCSLLRAGMRARVPSDLAAVLAAASALGALSISHELLSSQYYSMFFRSLTLIAREADGAFFMFLALLGAISSVFVICITDIFLLIKEGDLLRRSLIARLFTFLGRGKSVKRRLAMETLGVLGLSLTVFAAIAAIFYYMGLIRTDWLWIFAFVPLAQAAFYLWTMFSRRSLGQDLEVLDEAVKSTARCEFLSSPPLPPDSPLYESGKALVELGRISDEAIARGIAGEKLKVELISNISHDLRTPLTAIIGCAEQLTEAGEGGERARTILKKASLLRRMTDDLFDLSKAASGAEQRELSEIDLHMLTEQTLAEMREEIDRSGFEIKKDLAAQNARVRADGIRLHRVMANLISNALSYSIPNTRVWLSTAEEKGGVRFSIQNTANYEMDPSLDLTERGVRGSESRTGEGSGLGLAIAKTYTEAMGGAFDIIIRGDQFEAVIFLPRA